MPRLQNSWRSIRRAGSRRQSSFRRELALKSVDFAFILPCWRRKQEDRRNRGWFVFQPSWALMPRVGRGCGGQSWDTQAQPGPARLSLSRGDALLLIPAEDSRARGFFSYFVVFRAQECLLLLAVLILPHQRTHPWLQGPNLIPALPSCARIKHWTRSPAAQTDTAPAALSV